MALVGKAIGNEMFSAEDSMRYQQACKCQGILVILMVSHKSKKASVSDKEVNKLDLYANYAASAPCNIQTPPGKLVTCAQNCKRVLADGAVVLKTFL